LTKDGYAKILKISNTEGGRQRKIYTLTPKGKKTYKIALEAWRSTLPYIYKAIDFEYEDESTEAISGD
jgi:DNA-binding PadR family transcriptional regulator